MNPNVFKPIPHWATHGGITTDLMFSQVMGSVIEEGDYTVVRRPDSPDFYFGNFLLLKGAPDNRARKRLEDDFAALIGVPPRIKHRAFMWPMWPMWPVGANEPTALDAFISAGYELHESTVLIAESADLLEPDHKNHSITIRAYNGKADWDDWRRLNMADKNVKFPELAYRHFLAGQQALYERMIAEDRGDWWGAFLGDQQVANLGLFFTQKDDHKHTNQHRMQSAHGFTQGLTGRFQAVLTAPAYRHQGICRTLVQAVAKKFFEREGAARLVMVADEHYHAARIYESLGFSRRERMASLCWWPRTWTTERFDV